MKRKIALLLSLMLLVTALFPAGAFAANDLGLTNAIKAVKGKVDIPDSYTFSYYSSYTQEGRKFWDLEWTAPEDTDGYINACVDENGNIWRYTNYEFTDYSERKLPKVSWDDAKAKAESFIKKVNPVISEEIGNRDIYVPNLNDRYYSFYFFRKVNDIPLETNYARVEVDRQTGKIKYFYSTWLDSLVFPDPEGVIGIEKAQEAYKDQLGLRLEYRLYTKNDEINIFAVYAPKYTDKFIDAFTGEKADLTYDWIYGEAAGMGGMADGQYMAKERASANVKLSPEEEEAVRKTSNLMDPKKLEETVRGMDFLGLTDEYVLENDNLYLDWNDKESFTRSFYFVRRPSDEDDAYRWVDISLDAKTGEVKSFYISNPYDQGAEAKFNRDESLQAVEAFLKEFNPELFEQTVYDDSWSSDYRPLMEGEKQPLEYSFRFIRKVGDAVFPSNYIFARYDAVSGRVVGYSVVWLDVEFPSLENAIPIEDAYTKLFEEIGLELKYRFDYSYDYYMRNYGSEAKPEVKLVYDLAQGKPALFDANTGEIVDYMGQPYKEYSTPQYTDIEGSIFEDHIKILAENGIYLEGTEFRPNENIKQKDFFLLFSKVLGDYWYDPTLPEAEEVERLYSYLQRQGIIREGEKDLDATVSREEAVKFIIRALKYDKVADIKGIFVCDFKDADAINPDLVGYIAIASGMNIISGDANGNFNPQRLLTRGETAALVYNYLQR